MNKRKKNVLRLFFPPSKGLSVLVGSAYLSNCCGLSEHVPGELWRRAWSFRVWMFVEGQQYVL